IGRGGAGERGRGGGGGRKARGPRAEVGREADRVDDRKFQPEALPRRIPGLCEEGGGEEGDPGGRGSATTARQGEAAAGGACRQPDGRPGGEPGAGEGPVQAEEDRMKTAAPAPRVTKRPSRATRAAPGNSAADAVRAMVRPTANGRAVAAPASTVRVGRQQVSFSNLHKVLYPEAGFTKGEVVEYYLRIADAVLPHLKNRALTLKRYPNGVDAFFFYEKNCPAHR